MVLLLLHVVTGLCEAGDLGVVLPHEHMLLNFQGASTPAEYGLDRELSDLTFELKNLGKILMLKYSSACDLTSCCYSMITLIVRHNNNNNKYNIGGMICIR